MAWFRDQLTFPSKMVFALWRLSGNRFSLPAHLASGQTVILRHQPYADDITAQEIFVSKIYELPDSLRGLPIRQIVDLGANVGYSCLWWLHQFPDAHITAYEPHPAHIKQIRAHLQANAVSDHVTIIPKAAGTLVGQMHLTDAENSSTLLSAPAANTITVEVADWLEDTKTSKIDLLKMDIEGGEYALLSDPRFAQLNIQMLIMEWHNTAQYPDGQAWCTGRLKELGYQVTPVHPDVNNGLLWAFHQKPV